MVLQLSFVIILIIIKSSDDVLGEVYRHGEYALTLGVILGL